VQPRQRKTTEPPADESVPVVNIPAGTESASEQPEPDATQMPEAEPLPPLGTFYVRVRPGHKWQSVRSAGMVFTDQPMVVSADDPALAELKANPYLQVSEDATWQEP
jgi:hypothetical protein